MSDPILVQAQLFGECRTYIFVHKGENVRLVDRAPFGKFDVENDTVEFDSVERALEAGELDFFQHITDFKPTVKKFWKGLDGELKKVAALLRGRSPFSVAEDICVPREKKGKVKWIAERKIGKRWSVLRQYAAMSDFDDNGKIDRVDFCAESGVCFMLSALEWHSRERCWKFDSQRTGILKLLSRFKP